jgi:hypothetical protein
MGPCRLRSSRYKEDIGKEEKQEEKRGKEFKKIESWK